MTNQREHQVINIFVEGIPVPQGRPRFARVGQGVRTYDPPKSKKWKELVGWTVIAHPDCPSEPMHGPVSLVLSFYLPRPQRMAKDAEEPHIKKPDKSNLEKGIEDALTGIVWKDDSQIVESHTFKQYVLPERYEGYKPGVLIKVEEAL